MKNLTLLAFLLGTLNLFSQKQNNIWYFGHNAGLDFNTVPPTPLVSDLITLEGTASISDPAGHLLFYTNGATIWDRTHNIMPNGTGLMGGESSTQAALIVPIPNSCTQYYVFTTEDHYTNGGLSYSVVDMCLNNGLGDVVEDSKNTLLMDRTSEKLTAVLHSNGRDIWIITHRLSSNEFLAFLITDAGVNTVPVVTAIGSYYPADGHIGPAKASHDGSKIVSSATFNYICEMFDFNTATGMFSNLYDLNQHFEDDRWVYGLEFSSNDSLLYISTTFIECFLYQFNLYTSELIMLNMQSGNYRFGALQMGPDLKIYMARSDSAFLDVIHEPNLPGFACQYEVAGASLAPGTYSVLGLPNFAPYSFTIENDSVSTLGNDTTLCSGESLTLEVQIPNSCEATISWSDGSSGNSITVNTSGTYWVVVESSCTMFSDTIEVTFLPAINSFIQNTICAGEIFEGYSVSGTYIDSFPLGEGCDSIRTLELVVLPPIEVVLTKSICQNEIFEGYSISGTYQDTFELSSGCDSIRILQLEVLACAPIIHWDLNACRSFMIDDSHIDYSEFTADYPEFTCASIDAENVNRFPPEDNKHSCTPGVNNTVAMCVSSYSSCTYSADHQESVVIEFTVAPLEDSLFRFSKLEFYEKAPVNYNWISGPSGPNNYPRRYGIRILKNGVEVFRNESIPTNQNWTLQTFNFIDDSLFVVEENTIFRIELLPYCPIGNGADVSAWDLDEVKVYGACSPIEEKKPIILGAVSDISGKKMPGVEIKLSKNPYFSSINTAITDEEGNYTFEQIEVADAYYLQGYDNRDFLNGVSTLDLIMIQKHLLGKVPFTSLDQLVAADANRDGEINVFDILELQKLLLGIYHELSRNTSWRFGVVPQNMTELVLSQFLETAELKQITPDTHKVDFTGIKIGDVNGDVQLGSENSKIEQRFTSEFALAIDDQRLNKDHTHEIQIRSTEMALISGMQLSLDLEDLEILEVSEGALNLSHEDYRLVSGGEFRLSWASPVEIQLSENDVLFTLIIKSPSDVRLSEQLRISDELTPEIYIDKGLDIKNLRLDFREREVKLNVTENFSLVPNPFNSQITINWHLDRDEFVKIILTDLSGRVMYQDEMYYLKGTHSKTIATGYLSSFKGLIICRLMSDHISVQEKLIKL